MMPLRWPASPHGGDLAGHDEYAMWDAAYVLGSLSATDRREFEAQLADCPLCRSAVGELGGMPASCRSWIATTWRPSARSTAVM